jgi:hypothetical protein
MRPRVALFILALVALAASFSAAQVDPNYQAALLKADLSPAENAFCKKRIGSDPNQDNQNAWDACHVTRVFLRSCKNGTSVFPPIASIDWGGSDAERNCIKDVQTNASAATR